MPENLFITKIFVFQCSQNLWKNDGFVCFELKALYNTGHGHIVSPIRHLRLGASKKPHQKDYMAVLPGKISRSKVYMALNFLFCKNKSYRKKFSSWQKKISIILNIKRFSGIIYLKYVPWDYSLGIGESFFKIHSGGILKFLMILGAAVRLSGNRGQFFLSEILLLSTTLLGWKIVPSSIWRFWVSYCMNDGLCVKAFIN